MTTCDSVRQLAGFVQVKDTYLGDKLSDGNMDEDLRTSKPSWPQLKIMPSWNARVARPLRWHADLIINVFVIYSITI